MKDDFTANSHYLIYTFLFRKVGRMYFLNLGVKGLNKVHNNWNGAYHRSRNYVKAKMCKTNSNFEKFQNAVNLIYTVYGVLEMLM